MSAEVSFTKRAAAELSRCFNGLTSVNRSSSKKSTTSTTSTASSNSTIGGAGPSGSGSGGGGGAAAGTSSSTTSGVHSSLTSTSSGSLNDMVSNSLPSSSRTQEAGSGRASSKSSSSSHQQSSASEVTFLLTNTTPSSSSSPSKKSFFGGQSSSSMSTTAGETGRSPIRMLRSSSGAGSAGNLIQTSVQTLITKANTTLTPLKEPLTQVVNGEVHSTRSSEGREQAGSRVVGNRGPGTPSRRPSGPPPVAPRKTSIARRKNFLLNLAKPTSPDQLSTDFPFLNHFFSKYFTPKERTVLSQVSQRPDAAWVQQSDMGGGKRVPEPFSTFVQAFCLNFLFSSAFSFPRFLDFASLSPIWRERG